MKIDYSNYKGPKCFIPKEEKLKYFRSDKWTKIKCDLFMLRGEKCEDCGNRRNLHIHHLTYKNFGDENPDDLIILCGGCHLFAHNLAEIKKKKWISKKESTTKKKAKKRKRQAKKKRRLAERKSSSETKIVVRLRKNNIS